MAAHNPFTLTFGKIPNTVIPRQRYVSEITEEFSEEPPSRQVFLITGVRGCGKTVLMTSVSRELEQQGWIVVRLNPARDYLEEFARRLTDKCSSFTDVTERGFEISVMGTGFGVGARDKEDPVSRLNRLLPKIKEKGRKVLITVDEVQNNKSLKEFALQFQIFLTEEYPVFLIMTGLYEDIYEIQNSPGMTFLLRAPKIYPEPLSMVSMAIEYKRLLSLSAEEARRLAAITKGYAFAFQLLGSLYWDYGRNTTQQEILNKLDMELDEQVYRKVWEKMSVLDREVVRKLIGLEEVKVQELRRMLDMNSSKFSIYRDRLMKRGILCTPKYGYVAIALPRFSDVVKMYF